MRFSFFKQAICISLILPTILTGCGGQAANPVDRYMLGDEKKSCGAIYDACVKSGDRQKKTAISTHQQGQRKPLSTFGGGIIYTEVAGIDKEILEKNHKKSNRDFWNVVLFIGGCVIIVPFFFIDCKGSYEVEIDALKARKNSLQIIFQDKACPTPSEVNMQSK